MNREQHQTLRRHYRLNAKSGTAMISGSCNNSRYNYLLCAFLMLIRIAISDDCVDVAYWEDAYGNSCDVYESNSTLCETSGGLRNSFNLGYNAVSNYALDYIHILTNVRLVCGCLFTDFGLQYLFVILSIRIKIDFFLFKYRPKI